MSGLDYNYLPLVVPLKICVSSPHAVPFLGRIAGAGGLLSHATHIRGEFDEDADAYVFNFEPFDNYRPIIEATLAGYSKAVARCDL